MFGSLSVTSGKTFAGPRFTDHFQLMSWACMSVLCVSAVVEYRVMVGSNVVDNS